MTKKFLLLLALAITASVQAFGSESGPISEQPEGIAKEYQRDYVWGHFNWEDPNEFLAEEGEKITRVIEGTDGYWYIYNPQPTDDTRTYLKLRREGNKLIADLPQIIMREEQEDENGETYYRDFNAMLFDRSDNPDEKYVAKKSCQLEYLISENGTLSLNLPVQDFFEGIADSPSELYCMQSPDGRWGGRGILTDVLQPLDLQPVVIPKDAEIQNWVMISQNVGTPVEVGFSGDDVYLRGFEPEIPEATVKGTRYGMDLVLKSRQYLGLYDNKICYFYGANVTTLELTDDFMFMFPYESTEMKSMSDAWFVTNMSTEEVSYLSSYISPVVKFPAENGSKKPADPQIKYFADYYEDSGFCYLSFILPNIGVDGNILNQDNLYYIIYLDNEPFTFEPSDRCDIPEPITEIPYRMQVPGSIMTFGKYDTEHSVYPECTGFDLIGVQLINKDNGKTYASDVINYNVKTGEIGSGVNEIATLGEIRKITYHDIVGNAVAQETKGLLIKTLEYEDGTVRSYKIFNK